MARLFTLLIVLLSLTSCSQLGGLASKLKPGEKDDDFGKLPEMPEAFRKGRATVSKKDAPQDRFVAAGVDPAALTAEQGGVEGLTPESDIIFTNPDDVEASEEAVKGLFSVQRKDWHESHTEAKNLALLESKPLLIVFADTPSAQSGGSAASARLESELLARLDFAEWAGEHFIRLKLEYNIKDLKSADGKKQSLARRKEKYLKSLKKRYKVGGFPTILVISAEGSVIQNVRGYSSGNYEHVWGLLRTAVVHNKDRQEAFEKKLLKKGYRRWQGTNDNRVLARLASYRDGELVLIAPNGVRYQTQERNLSADDRLWLEEQKEKRSR